MSTRSYDIVSGPCKDTLFDACKYAYSKNVKIQVVFSIAIGYTAPKHDPGCCYIPMSIADIRITSIEHEDGSGESLNLRGYCRADLTNYGGTSTALKPYKFEAYYNAKTRRGFISFS